jgi:hypothetical protein
MNARRVAQPIGISPRSWRFALNQRDPAFDHPQREQVNPFAQRVVSLFSSRSLPTIRTRSITGSAGVEISLMSFYWKNSRNDP